MELIIMDKTELTNKDIELWEASFDKKRVSAVNKKRPNDRNLSICGDLLILKVAKSVGLNGFSVKYGNHGKPYFEGTPIHFNVSHKGTKAVCAYGDKPLGVDIEDINPFNLRLAKKICTENELQYINGDPKKIAEVWTVKEAYSKLCGRGISMGLSNIIIDMAAKKVCNLDFKTIIFDGYVCTVVSEV